jgi:hypothetical protein
MKVWAGFPAQCHLLFPRADRRWGRTPVLRPASTPAHGTKSLAARERDVDVPRSSGELPHLLLPHSGKLSGFGLFSPARTKRG